MKDISLDRLMDSQPDEEDDLMYFYEVGLDNYEELDFNHNNDNFFKEI